MNVQVDRLENSQVKLTITVEPERIDEAKKKAARALSREVNIPGFRRGKAPYSMIKQFVGEQTLLQEAVEEMAPEVIDQAIEEAEIDVWSYEHIEPRIESLDPLVFEVFVPTAPSVELGDVGEIDVEREDTEVGEEDVEETVQALREQQATWIPATGPAEYGDRITIDLRGERLDGEVVLDVEGEELQLRRLFADDEGDAADEILLPGHAADEDEGGPDIMAELRGMSVNQTKEFSLSYPEDWSNERMAGRTIMYTATLLDLKKQVLPELDTEFAQTVGDFEDMDELRGRLRENIRAEAEQEQEEEFVTAIMDQLVELSTVSYPQALEDDWVERRTEEAKSQFEMYGFTFDQFLEMSGQTEEAFEENIREEVRRDIKRGLVLTEYGRRNDIRVTEEEFQRELGLVSAQINRQGIDQSVLEAEDVRHDIRERLLSRKIINCLRSEVTGEPERPLFPVDEEELEEEVEPDRDLEIAIAAEDLETEDEVSEESTDATTDVESEHESVE